MEKIISYPGKNPLLTIKSNENLPEQGIIFVLEPQPGKYKNEAVGNVLFYEKGISEISIMEEKFGGHITVHAPGQQIIFAIQNLENPNSKREPYNRQSGYIPISFKNLNIINISNNMRVLIQKKAYCPPRNYALSNWPDSFSRAFEKGRIDELKLTMINSLDDKLGIAEEDAKVIAEKIISKLT